MAADWRASAACAADPDLFFSDLDAPAAMHICLFHCAVTAECRADVLLQRPVACVQAGVVWNAKGRPDGTGYRPNGTCGKCRGQR